jgi:hypothetical protein
MIDGHVGCKFELGYICCNEIGVTILRVMMWTTVKK